MRQILELSIFSFLSLGIFAVVMPAEAKPRKTTPVIAARMATLNLDFLSQAEDIEREAWWVVTATRDSGLGSPFRVFRAAAVTTQKVRKTKVDTKFCKSLLVVEQGLESWRIEAACQKPAIEIGVVSKLNSKPEKWKVTWKTGPFKDHFGLSTAILYTQQSCEIELDAKGRIAHMKCPNYVRDQRLSEIVEFKVFNFSAKAPQVLKLEGEVKKDLQVISTFKTSVPILGDIVLKVKNVPQISVEDKSEISNIGQPGSIRGDSNGQKGSPQKENAQENIKQSPKAKSSEIISEKSNEGASENNGNENSYEKSRKEKDREEQAAREKNLKDYGQKIEPETNLNQNSKPQYGPGAVNPETPESNAEAGEVPAIEVPPIAPSR